MAYFSDADLQTLWDKAVDQAECGPGGSGLCVQHYYNELLKKHQGRDGVPAHVANACWEAAIRSCPPPKRGRNVAGEKEYKRRIEQWKEKQFKAIEKSLKTIEQKGKLVAPLIQVGLEKPLKTAEKAREFISEVVEQTVMEDWEELYCDDDAPQPLATKTDVQKMVKRLNVEKQPVHTAALPHGHEQLAKSRTMGDACLRTKGLKHMVQARQNGAFRPVVFDVGSGASGVNKAYQLMAGTAEGRQVFWHCTFPIARGDLERDHLLLGQSLNTPTLIQHVNWVEETGVPMLDKVNVCRHLARDCNCLAMYTNSYVMCVHSPYYFTDDDFRQLFKYTDTVNYAMHLPERFGVGYPSGDPEFTWEMTEVSRRVSTVDWLRAKARSFVCPSRQDVTFAPLRAHGTTYTHQNPTPDHERGGFHMLPAWLTTTSTFFTDNDVGLAIATAGKAMSALYAGYAVVEALKGRPTKAVSALVAGLCFAAPSSLVTAHRNQRSSIMPLPGSQYTVSIIDGKNMTYAGENAVTMGAYKRTPLHELHPRLISSYAVDQKMANELAATMAMSSDRLKEKAPVVAMAKCLREGLTPLQTKQTVDRALEMISEAKNGPLPGRPSGCVQAIVGPAFALGATWATLESGGASMEWVMEACQRAADRLDGSTVGILSSGQVLSTARLCSTFALQQLSATVSRSVTVPSWVPLPSTSTASSSASVTATQPMDYGVQRPSSEWLSLMAQSLLAAPRMLLMPSSNGTSVPPTTPY